MEKNTTTDKTIRQSFSVGNGRTANSASDYRKINPVLLAFEQELGRFIKYMKKKSELGKRWKKPDEEAYARGSNTLYNLWNTYEPRLSQDYYLNKLIKTGDFLYSIQEYKLALSHCYGRYVDMFKQEGVTLERAAQCDMEEFREIYLPGGLENHGAIMMLRSLLGMAICDFYVKIADDTNVQNPDTWNHCVSMLKVLRVLTQIALHKEELCWLVFNGTVHIYSISRHLMAFGYSSKVLEFLIWASVCMESSIPLLTVKYLPWRSTLYTAVCQCYYDIKAPTHAEMFAKRGMNKVHELEDVEKISTSEPSPETDEAFRQAKAKMQIMVFRRIVFETRKRPKGLLRPKTKPNLKDTINQPWPRTATERLLADTLHGTSAQFLAILEALSEPHKRTLQCEGPAPDADDTVSDVIGELFFAGLELLAGGGGTRQQHAHKHTTDISPSVSQLGNTSLMELVAKGANGVPVFALVKFVKKAFSYEQWETFDSLAEPTLQLLNEYGDASGLTDKKTLELMLALQPFHVSSRKVKKLVSIVTEDGEESKPEKKSELPTHAQGFKAHVLLEELVHLADVVESCAQEPYKSAIIAKDVDMIVDTSLFLWSKCKSHFQKVNSPAMESCRQILNMHSAQKWLYILNTAHHAMSWSNAASSDPILCAELALKLALVLECKASTNEHAKGARVSDVDVVSTAETTVEQTDLKEEKAEAIRAADRSVTPSSECSRYASNMADIESLGRGPGARGLLLKACEVLEQGVDDISRAREAIVDTSGQTIADVSWMKLPSSTSSSEVPEEAGYGTMSDGMVKASHMELLFAYHRVSRKLAAFGENSDFRRLSKKPKMTDPGAACQFPTEAELLQKCNKNPLSKALFLMHKAGFAVTSKGLTGTKEQSQLLQESMDLIKKAQQQDRKLMSINKLPNNGSVEPSDVPGAPLLLFKGASQMVLRPAPFIPKSGEKVAWYRLFARSASGNNVKVRLNDYQLRGTGEETPATENCKLHVKGLKANEKYVFAVAAYSMGGKLIGGSIGATSRPVLASLSLPCLMAWGYLTQIAYTAGIPSVAKAAACVLWDYFVNTTDPEETTSSVHTAGNDLCVTLERLDEERLYESSLVLVRQFLQSVFVSVDIALREGFLYCDTLCDNGPLYNGQVSRLKECERLLLAIQVAGWLNDNSMCLQAVVQCYGLLAPMIHEEIPAKPVVQILLQCHAVLQEIPSLSRHRKQSSTSDSISHMIATITYYIAKVLQKWNEQGVGSTIVELGKKMLNIDTAPDSSGSMATVQEAAALAAANVGGAPPPPKKKKGANKKSKVKEPKFKSEKEFTPVDGQNEELKALETYIMKLSQKALHRTEDEELTGSEDPSVLNSCVSNLPVKQALKEVVKFKRRTRFLGFYVQVLARAIKEGLTETVLEWNIDTMNWLSRRNEVLLASKPTLVQQAATAAGPEDEKLKKFATALVEFGKPPTRAPRTQHTRHAETRDARDGRDRQDDEIHTKFRLEATRSSNLKSIVPVSRKVARRMRAKTAEELDMLKAADTLQLILPEYWRTAIKRKKLRGVSSEELPWRAQMNILVAGANLEVFLDRVDGVSRSSAAREQPNAIFRPSFMDPIWFGFATSGTLIVPWPGNATATKVHSPDVAKTLLSAIATETVHTSPVGTSGRTYHRTSQLSQGDGFRTGSRLTLGTVSEKEASNKPAIFYLRNVFNLLHKAMVLAHRGKYWTLLQNACRSLWNAAQMVVMRVLAGSLRIIDDPDVDINVRHLRSIMWLPFYTAADFLLDILVHVQNEVKLDTEHNKKRNKVKAGDLEVKSEKGLMGGVESERGGASLVFESPLDNLSIFNSRWLKNILLYAVELLFHEEKWERVVDIILRFNAFSRSRYAEQVLPMLIVAQQKLRERVAENGGPLKSQPSIKVSSETGVAEEIFIKPTEYPFIEPAVHIDPEGHNVYSGSNDALRLVSVPLDINNSMKMLHSALELKHHTARSLEHSRQLLLCYLAGQLDGSIVGRLTRGSSRVGFIPSQVKPPTDVPPDRMEDFFETTEDIQTYTLQSSQLAVVISSYDKTIEMLLFRQQRGLAAQAMHELGNIMFHTGNIRVAYKWWAEALDTILNMSDALKNWRDILPSSTGSNNTPSSAPHTSNPNSAFLQRCGLWGCLLGGVLASNIAQYIHTSNLGLRLDCCLLSASLFKALFCASLPHPTADKDYALYDIGSDQEVKELIPGIDLLSELFRSDGRSVVAALRWVTEELVRARHLLTVLPLLTLCQYFTTHVCRDLQRSVDVRILRVRVLTDLGMFSEAIQILIDLLHGERLPRNGNVGFRAVEEKSTLHLFDNKVPLVEENNIQVLNDILERQLPSSLASLYGQNLFQKLAIAHAHLLVAIASTVFAIPANMMEEVHRHLAAREAEARAKSVPPSTAPPPTLSKKTIGRKIEDDALMRRSSQPIVERKSLIDVKKATSEIVKGFLLSVAELSLKKLSESLNDSQEGSVTNEATSLMSADLEILCHIKLELSRISAQKQHSLTAGSLIYSAMRTLEEAAVLNELEMETRVNTTFTSSPTKSGLTISSASAHTHYLSSQARCRLDARLWLNLRLSLAKALSGEDSGIGKLGGTARSVTASIGSCSHHCEQGLDEAEAFGDSEMMAEFMIVGAVHSLQQGKITEELLQQFECAIQRLENTPSLSFAGQSLLALSIVQFADIKGSRHHSDIHYLKKPLTAYTQAEKLLLNQMMLLGEKICMLQMAPLEPLQNIYLPQLLIVAQIKLRLGILSLHGSTEFEQDLKWRESMNELHLGLQMTRAAACEEKALEAQLLFNIGRIQRQLINHEELESYEDAAATLVEAIMATYSADHNLGLMRQAYMEMALVHLQIVEKLSRESSFTLEVPFTSDTHKTKGAPKTPKLSKKEKEERERQQKELKARKRELDKERKKAWTAIRASGLVSAAQYKLGLLTGDADITTLHIPEKSGKSIPDFALFDLLGTDDVIGQNNSYVTKGGIVSLGTSVNNSNRVQITWIHLLGYLSFLRRQCSYAALGVSVESEGNSVNDSLMPLFSWNKVLKLSRMQAFLNAELETFSTECCGVYPSEILVVPRPPTRPTSDGQSVQDTDATGQEEEKVERRKDPLMTSEKSIAAGKAADLEVCVQWYVPLLDPPDVQESQERDPSHNAVHLVYALNKTAVTSVSSSGSPVVIGQCHVPLDKTQSLHEKLMNTVEIANADLQPVATGSKKSRAEQGLTSGQVTPDTKRMKRSMGIKALSARQRREDRCKARLKEHIEEINQILLPHSGSTSDQEVPFEISVANVTFLEAMFDPSRGHIGRTTENFFTWFSGLLQS